MELPVCSPWVGLSSLQYLYVKDIVTWRTRPDIAKLAEIPAEKCLWARTPVRSGPIWQILFYILKEYTKLGQESSRSKNLKITPTPSYEHSKFVDKSGLQGSNHSWGTFVFSFFLLFSLLSASMLDGMYLSTHARRDTVFRYRKLPQFRLPLMPQLQ